MTSASQVYRLPSTYTCPDDKQMEEAMRLANANPGARFEMPWLEPSSKTRYTLTVHAHSASSVPDWHLIAGSGSELTHLWSQSSNNFKRVQAAVLKLTKGEPDLRLAFEEAHHATLASHLKPAIQADAGQRLSGPYPALDADSNIGLDTQSIETKKSETQTRRRDLDASILVGDLLQMAGAVTKAELADALPFSKRTGLPIGRILIESGTINENLLRAAVLAQSLMRDGMLHFNLAVQAVKVVREQNETLESALKRLGWRSEYYQTTNKLGHLLLDAGCISKQQLSQALEICFASGLPLGRVLVVRKVVPEVVAYAGLSAQVLLREGKIPRSEAVAAVKLAASMQTTIQGWLEHGGILPSTDKKMIRLGELLSLAGIVTELDLLSSVERGLLEEKPIGQLLISAGVINEKTLKQALRLQDRVRKSEIGPFEAATLLASTVEENNNNSKSDQATSERTENDGLSQLLGLVGLSEMDDPKALLQEVLIQKQNLAYKVVTQHEEVKHRLARELHDTIIADLLMLRRYLSGDRKLTTDQTIEIVDDVVRQLRDICHDFAPRQLHEWGLENTLMDLTERVKGRTGIDCSFRLDGKVMDLAEPVQLHIFRIVQESLNNVEKYAFASQAKILIEAQPSKLVIAVSDNGKGFEQGPKMEPGLSSGGMGMQSMRERVELIRCYYPTNLTIESKAGEGSEIILEISLPNNKSGDDKNA